MMTRDRVTRFAGDAGFTLVEFMIAMAITTAVLGATVALATQIQQAYTTQLDDAAVEQEVRYSLDWIARYLRSAGSNPYVCPAPFKPVWFDPNENGDDDDVQIQADINPPGGGCADDGEDVTIALDVANKVITLDTGAGAVAMTEPVIEDLQFTYLDSSHNVTASEAAVAYVRVRVTGQSEVRERTGDFDYTRVILETEVRMRAR